MMDLSKVMPWVVAANTLFIFIGFVKTWLSSGEKVLAEDISAAKKTIIDHDRRIQAIEGDMKHLPDRETTHRMELAMSEINGKLNVMAERLKPIESIGERLQETLLMEHTRR